MNLDFTDWADDFTAYCMVGVWKEDPEYEVVDWTKIELNPFLGIDDPSNRLYCIDGYGDMKDDFYMR